MSVDEPDTETSSVLRDAMKTLAVYLIPATPPDTTLSDEVRMQHGSDGEQGARATRGSRYGWGAGISTPENSAYSRPGRYHKGYQSNSKKVVQSGENGVFPFMSLPREIRNKIYHESLTRPDGTFFIFKFDDTKFEDTHPHWGRLFMLPLPLIVFSRYPFKCIPKYRANLDDPDESLPSTRNVALLRASKTVHAEAVGILYGQRLVFEDILGLQTFLTNLHPSRIGLLRDVALAFRNQSHEKTNHLMPRVFSLLAGADNLVTLCPDITDTKSLSFKLSNSFLHADATTSVADWDLAVARSLAAEVYRQIFTYLRWAVPTLGIDKVMEVLDVFWKVFQFGLCAIRAESMPAHVRKAEWTEEREVALRKAMGQEIERLVTSRGQLLLVWPEV